MRLPLYSSQTHKTVISLARPMILSGVSIPLLGIVDTAILGHLDSSIYLGAVAVGARIMAFVFWGLGFLRMGTTALTAQALGRSDTRAIAHTLAHSFILALILGLLIVTLRTPLLTLTLSLINPSIQLQELAYSYCNIRIWGAPGVLITLVAIGWLIGQQDTRSPLLIMVTTNVANILLDVVFILGLEMSSDGAAIATLIADYLGCSLACGLIWRRHAKILKSIILSHLLKPHYYRQLLKINGYLFLRTQLLLFVFAFFNAQGAQMGDDTLAANAIIMQLLMLVSYGLDGFAHASEALIGRAVGAKNNEQFQSTLLITGFWSLIIALSMSVIFFAFEGYLIALFTDIPSVKEQLEIYYPWIFLLPLLSAAGYWLDGVFIGSGAGREMLYAMSFSVLAIFLPCWYLTLSWNNHGLWLSLTLFNLFRGLSLAALLTSLTNKLRQSPSPL